MSTLDLIDARRTARAMAQEFEEEIYSDVPFESLPAAPKKPRAKASKSLEYALADSLDEFSTEFADELIEGLLIRSSMSVIYGDSNSGKTFLAIDIGAAVALQSPWMGRNVEGGMVVYLATESPSSVRNRLRAYQRHYGRTVPHFVIVSSPINLYDGAADTSAVIDLITSLEAEMGVKCEMVIGDTLARMSAGANENSGEDMTVVLKHLDRIKDLAKSAVLLIHHTGKDAAKGMRGWSGLRAAVDTELEVTCNEISGTRTLEITKQRDMGGKGDRIGFRLDSVPMGTSKWGKQQTSCVVVPADAPAKKVKGPKLGETQQAVLALLKGANKNMRQAEIATLLEPQGLSKGTVYNAVRRLQDVQLIEVSAGLVHLIGGMK
jgi:hypothetical protein